MIFSHTGKQTPNFVGQYVREMLVVKMNFDALFMKINLLDF